MLYRGFGLTIASDFAIPGAVAVETSDGAPDLIVERSACLIGAGAQLSEPYRVLDQKLELTVPGIARYLLASPDRLLVDPAAEASQADVSALLIASGIPMSLWARGGLLLHASGVILPESKGAMALAGASGSGKSVLARALVHEGARLVGDDSLWLRESDGEVITTGLPGGIFSPDTGSGERPFWPVPDAAKCETADVAGIVILDPFAPTKPQRLSGADALKALLRHRHRPRVPALLGLEAERLAFTALLCARLPVYALGGNPGVGADRVAQIHELAGSAT